LSEPNPPQRIRRFVFLRLELYDHIRELHKRYNEASKLDLSESRILEKIIEQGLPKFIEEIEHLEREKRRKDI